MAGGMPSKAKLPVGMENAAPMSLSVQLVDKSGVPYNLCVLTLSAELAGNHHKFIKIDHKAMLEDANSAKKDNFAKITMTAKGGELHKSFGPAQHIAPWLTKKVEDEKKAKAAIQPESTNVERQLADLQRTVAAQQKKGQEITDVQIKTLKDIADAVKEMKQGKPAAEELKHGEQKA